MFCAGPGVAVTTLMMTITIEEEGGWPVMDLVIVFIVYDLSRGDMPEIIVL